MNPQSRITTGFSEPERLTQPLVKAADRGLRLQPVVLSVCGSELGRRVRLVLRIVAASALAMQIRQRCLSAPLFRRQTQSNVVNVFESNVFKCGFRVRVLATSDALHSDELYCGESQHGYDAALITRSATIQWPHFFFKRRYQAAFTFNRVELHASFNVARKY